MLGYVRCAARRICVSKLVMETPLLSFPIKLPLVTGEAPNIAGFTLSPQFAKYLNCPALEPLYVYVKVVSVSIKSTTSGVYAGLLRADTFKLLLPPPVVDSTTFVIETPPVVPSAFV